MPAIRLPALIANNYGEMLSMPSYESALMLAAFLLVHHYRVIQCNFTGDPGTD